MVALALLHSSDGGRADDKRWQLQVSQEQLGPRWDPAKNSRSLRMGSQAGILGHLRFFFFFFFLDWGKRCWENCSSYSNLCFLEMSHLVKSALSISLHVWSDSLWDSSWYLLVTIMIADTRAALTMWQVASSVLTGFCCPPSGQMDLHSQQGRVRIRGIRGIRGSTPQAFLLQPLQARHCCSVNDQNRFPTLTASLVDIR